MGKILVTGGCGYIGSHTIVELIQLGYEVVCIDDLSNSDGSAIAGIESITGVKVKNTKISVGDSVALQTFFKEEGPIEAVIHFAAFKAVNESVTFPLKYYQNNLASLLALIETMKSYHCNNLIFSSSCSVYGDAETLPVNEQTTLGVIQSPYARTKLIGEEILKDCCIADPEFKVIALRYFNPAGAHISNFIGESPTINASNLVPVITETAIGKRQEMSVFGDDYPTRDGTCIRDYIHVSDIGSAHAIAISYMKDKMDVSNFEIFNLGSANGNTVLEVIHAFEKSNGLFPKFKIVPRRAGDVIAIYADNRKALDLLNWKIKHNLEDIVRTAWEWEKKRSI